MLPITIIIETQSDLYLTGQQRIRVLIINSQNFCITFKQLMEGFGSACQSILSAIIRQGRIRIP